MNEHNPYNPQLGRTLVNRLFDRGVFQPMPSVHKQVNNDRPLTSKIAIQAALRSQQLMKQDVNTSAVSRLPPIEPQDPIQSHNANHPNSQFRNTRFQQVVHTRGKSVGFNKQYNNILANDTANNFNSFLPPSRQQISRGKLQASNQVNQTMNQEIDRTFLNSDKQNTSFDIGRPLIQSKQIIDLMEKMQGKQMSPQKELILAPIQSSKGKRIMRESVILDRTLQNIQTEEDEIQDKKPMTRGQQRKKQTKQSTQNLNEKASDQEEESNDNSIFKLKVNDSLILNKDIDTFIQMIREHKLSAMEFIYLIKSKMNTNDAYNMKVVEYHLIQEKSITNYYTLSAKGLTRYENNIPIEFVNLGDWLKERDQFNAIKSLSFFRKFRTWKTLKKWTKTVYQNESRRIQKLINDRLLILNPVYQKLLLKHRFLCSELEGLRFVDVSEQSESLNLSDFQRNQQSQRREVVTKLQQFSAKMHENCKTGVKTAIDNLRTQITNEMTDDDEEQLKTYQKKQEGTQNRQTMDDRKAAIENLGFPENMNYGHRAMMRSEFVRFLRLAYLLDFIAVQSLGQVYISSTTEFLIKFQRVSDCCTQTAILQNVNHGEKEDEPRKRRDNAQEWEPIFKLEMKWYGDNPRESLKIHEEPVLVESLQSSLADFDLEKYASLKSPEVEVEEVSPTKKKGNKKDVVVEVFKEVTDDEPDYTSKRMVSNIHDAWLQIYPPKRDFVQLIDETISEGLDSIQVLERWSKHPQFLPYVQALEEWDEIIGDRWNKPESIYLNPSYWIKEHRMFAEFHESITQQFDAAFDRLDRFQEEFGPIMTLVWREETSSFNILSEQRLKRQLKVFSLCLQSFQHIESIIKTQLVSQTDLGIFKVQTEAIQTSLLTRQQKQLQRLEDLLVALFRKRAVYIKQWLQQSVRSLTGMVIKIEEFVEQKNSVDRIAKELPGKRDEIEVVSGLLQSMQECSIGSIRKDDREIAQELVFLEGSLNVALSEADNNTAKNIDRFKKTLKERIEKLKVESLEINEHVMHERFLLIQTQQVEAIRDLQLLDGKLVDQEGLVEKYNMYEEILQVQESAQYDVLEAAREQMNLRLSMWSSIEEFKNLSLKWRQLPFSQINAKEIAEKADHYYRVVMRCEKGLQDNKVLQHLKRMVWEFRDTVPVVKALSSDYLQADHWLEIKSLVKADFNVNDMNFTLEKLLSLNVASYQQQITEIAVKAYQEDALKHQLGSVESHWAEVEVTLKSYKDSQENFVLGDVDDILQQLDEGMATMSNILASRYVKPLRPRAEKVSQDLLQLSDIIDKWLECQKKWVYLESIFTSPDIKKQLPTESQQFDQCDKFIKKIIKTVSLKPQILKLLQIPGISDNLSKISESLDQIEKSLEENLEVKRSAFPRFYFLSNDELIEILARQTNIQAVQLHLNKCFEGVTKLYLGDANSTGNMVYGVISPDGEQIVLFKTVQSRGNVELWLDLLQKELVETLRRLTKQGLQDYMNGIQKTRNEWILQHRSQIVSVVSQILWSINTEDAINENGSRLNALNEWFDVMVTQLNQLTQLVRGELTAIQRKTIVALITTDVHNRDTVYKLADTNVENVYDFMWQQQLRYYWEEEADDCIVRQVTSQFNYGYEYMGATSRLVITPLTDRCWITITSALSNQLGASPQGPAGTGKTESTKDLAKGMGRLCIVFNCSDQITAAMMNKLFSGLVQQGAWTCLDEFNRIDIEVLSVIAQQLLVIRMALLVHAEEFVFDGRTIPLKHTCGFFITMNPGYAGRSELPDNLKSLFRPVAMMIPDYRLIAEIMLYAEGFENASALSNKMVQLYKLSSEQLSQQDHYDFGMRAVKSLLVMAGSLKRNEIHLSEEVVLIRAMRDSNIPKFLKDDLPLFSALLQDLFPGVIIPTISYGVLDKVIRQRMSANKLQQPDTFITKILQLFDTLNVRFGAMIVGPSGAGKTTCYRILALAVSYIKQYQLEPSDPRYQYIKYFILNPKSISMGELYGEVDTFTNEWRDGLASHIIREFNTVHPDEPNWDPLMKYWVVYDGPVDALWIENMNSVLDDSMTLCLANSERIKIRTELRMLFEVQDLAVASPATVSRCGMVYMTPEDLGWQVYVKSWVQSYFGAEEEKQAKQYVPCSQIRSKSTTPLVLESKYQEQLMNLLTYQLNVVMVRVSSFVEPFMTVPLQRAQNVCNILERLISDLNKLFQNKEDLTKKLIYCFTYAVIWGIGASFEQQHHEKFGLLIKEVFATINYPVSDSIFDFFVDTETMQSFVLWDSKLEEFEYSKEVPYFQLMVPTIDTTKFTYTIRLLLEQQRPILVSGKTGVGKSIVIQNLLYDMKLSSRVNSVMLNFSAQTAPQPTQLAIESKMNKKSKSVWGARPNEKIAIFIDDINMPALENFGAQPCIELLRQMVDTGGFFDRQKLFWKHIEDTTMVCACAPPGGGRNALTQRFMRHFNILNMPQPSDNTLVKIFGQIMKGFLQSFNFSDVVRKMYDYPVYATIDMYRKISKELLPIPSKFHYTFNLRDISKVFQGMLMVKPSSVNNPEVLARLWIHECSRVFADRLITPEDHNWFKEAVYELVVRNFRINWSKEDLFKTSILFSDILKLESTQVLYEEVTEKRKVLVKALEDKQEEYLFATNDRLDLVFFDDALDHVLQIARILRQPRGNGMIIGVGGSGKQSLAKLASFLLKSSVFQIELIKSYNGDSFRQDLQKISIKTGVQRIPVAFILTDVQIAYESFLEDTNNLLNTGEVTNLFSKKEDMEMIYDGVRQVAIKQKRPDSPESLWTCFVEGVRENLHIILCMSPVGEQLRVRCRKFPSLVNCCTQICFQKWPKEALLEVANKFLEQMPGLEYSATRESLAQMCSEVAISVEKACERFYLELHRRVYTTPKSYLDQIKLYTKLFGSKQQDTANIRKKLAEGLGKLYKTNEIVSQLKTEMIELKPRLVEQQEKTEIFLKQLAIDQAEANQKERFVNDEAQIVNAQASEIKIIADEAQSELDKAVPVLKEAEEALSKLNKGDISEIKGFPNPPLIVVMVLEAICVLLGEKTDWTSAKQVMMQVDFLEKLQKFDRANISEGTLRRLRTLTSKPDFDPVFVAQKSLACKSLCLWCRAIDNYARVQKEVEPRRKKVLEMQSKFDFKNRELKVKSDELKRVRDKVARLQQECDETVDRKNTLQSDLERTEKRCDAAERLTTLLADEGVRWKEQIDVLELALRELIGDVFVGAATISYLGAFTGPYRDTLVKEWLAKLVLLDVPCSDSYTLSGCLETPIVIRDWGMEGLPIDQLSVDNAVITKKCERWPLMIDPQGEATKWLKQHEANNNLKLLKFSHTHFLKQLQGAVSNGYPVLFDEVEERLEPAIDSVLQKQVLEVDGRRVIRVGDQRIDYDQNFRLYLCCKHSNPHFLPEIFIKVTVINFSITFEGLQDQLLGEVMKYEKPEIEIQRDDIIVKMSSAKKSLKEAQDQILEMLAEAKGMILDDDDLINTLERSKQQSQDIIKSLMKNSIIEIQVNDYRNKYLSVAVRGTVLYFVISDLAGIDPMYQYSLQYFKKLFRSAVEQARQSDILQERLMYLEACITKSVYTDICRGLFESHKKIFSFLICTSIRRQGGLISQISWNLVLRGAPSVGIDKIPNPDKSFFKEQTWSFIQACSQQVPDFDGLALDIKSNLANWKEFSAHENLYSRVFPVQSALSQKETLNPFLRLLIIKALRPEKLMQSFSAYVADQMGSYYDEVPSSTLDSLIMDSDERTPIIFILSPGADPTQALFKLAKENQRILEVISLGQGQGRKAELMIEKGQKEDLWVLLQNCHLAKSWMTSLEAVVQNLVDPHSELQIKPGFRMILTSMPASYFPVSVLQNGIKVTTEPPRGLKANLRRSYQEFGQVFDSSEGLNRQKEFRSLIFATSFFHAVVQERRKFGPLGFNKAYEFNDSDLDISVLMMRMFVSGEDDLPWDAMQYMLGQINYGGRVTDDWDRTCLMCILRNYVGDHVLLEDKVKFSMSGIYYVPVEGRIQEYRKYIDQLPNFEDPEVFGMHENANIAFERQESQNIIESVLSIQPMDGNTTIMNILIIIAGNRGSESGVAKSLDDTVLEIAGQFESDLPLLLRVESCNPKHSQLTELGSIPSLSTVLMQEIEKYNKLLNLVNDTLKLLQQAIKGFVVISYDLDEMYVAFINNQIPKNWRKASFDSLKPLASWFNDLIQRVSLIRQWMERDSVNAYWMSGLFYPQGFLTGVLQTHSRKYKVAIDKLAFKFKFIDTEVERIKEEPKDGVNIWGMFIEGARWDGQHETLVDQSLGQLSYPMPIILLQPMENFTPPEDVYSCPCYKTSNRQGILSTTGQSTNFILAIDIPSKHEKSEFWTLRGTAIISQLND